ncbi:transporter family protein [Tenacibaculum maritimum]|uniref:hypothetical protein n=1 Tax=Tenacibaculum maritimum TaxID=107401 RepID=UPI003875B3A5
MKKKFLILALGLVCTANYSQEKKQISSIDAQRPTLTESYSIVDTNMLQLENGIDFYETSDTSYNTFLRGAISDRIELRAATDYKTLNTVGAKAVVIAPNKTVLGIGTSFIYNRNLDNKSNDFRLAMSKSFNKLFVTYNLGYDVDFYNIFLVGVPISKEFNYFVEYYNNTLIDRVHTGVTWIFHKDIQVDINGGWMENEEWYGGVGLSFRLR